MTSACGRRRRRTVRLVGPTGAPGCVPDPRAGCPSRGQGLVRRAHDVGDEPPDAQRQHQCDGEEPHAGCAAGGSATLARCRTVKLRMRSMTSSGASMGSAWPAATRSRCPRADTSRSAQRAARLPGGRLTTGRGRAGLARGDRARHLLSAEDSVEHRSIPAAAPRGSVIRVSGATHPSGRRAGRRGERKVRTGCRMSHRRPCCFNALAGGPTRHGGLGLDGRRSRCRGRRTRAPAAECRARR
jgi:hypothetical protein